MTASGHRTSDDVYAELSTLLETFHEKTAERDKHDAHGEATSMEYVEEERAEIAVEIAELLVEFDQLMRHRAPLPRAWRAGPGAALRRLRAANAA